MVKGKFNSPQGISECPTIHINEIKMDSNVKAIEKTKAKQKIKGKLSLWKFVPKRTWRRIFEASKM